LTCRDPAWFCISQNKHANSGAAKMRFGQLFSIIGMACSLSLPADVKAAEISSVQNGSPCHIRLSGPIATGDAKRIETNVNSD
jgi:hypothetical protein